MKNLLRVMKSSFSGLIALLLVTALLGGTAAAAGLSPDVPHSLVGMNYKLITDITPTGQKVMAVVVEYESNVLANENLKKTYGVSVNLEPIAGVAASGGAAERTITAAYTSEYPFPTGNPSSGRYVILELDADDSAAWTYKIKIEDTTPLEFRARTDEGAKATKKIIQARAVPQFYNEKMIYTVEQKGYVKLSNGKTVDKNVGQVTGATANVVNRFIDQYEERTFADKSNSENKLQYRLYKPAVNKEGQKKALVLFLHGSGQVGTDNIAQIISNKGAVVWPTVEECYVVAPQCPAVFDVMDAYNAETGKGGGIHWQSKNRRTLLLGIIDELIAANPTIDTSRIYVQGLSRGAEGAMYLMLDRPNFFAAAVLMSGREAGTMEWIDGQATAEKLASLKHMPIWFFHNKEDNISPVAGSRINYKLLSEDVGSTVVRYTEFTVTQPKALAGDNGLINPNAHNTWDIVYNSPEVKHWLFSQKRK